MKKLGFFALALSLSALLSSTPAFANNNKANDKASTVTPQQAQPAQPELPEVCFPFYKEYFEEKTDFDKKYIKAKTFLEKCPQADEYWLKGPKSFIAKYELNKLRVKCVDADKLFFGSPNEANLNSRSHATVRKAGSATRLNRSSNRRPPSSTAHWCSLVWIFSTRTSASTRLDPAPTAAACSRAPCRHDLPSRRPPRRREARAATQVPGRS